MPVLIEKIPVVVVAVALFFSGLMGIGSNKSDVTYNKNGILRGVYDKYNWEVILCKDDPDISKITVINKNKDVIVKYERAWTSKPKNEKEWEMVREIVQKVVDAQENKPWEHIAGKINQFRKAVKKITTT